MKTQLKIGDKVKCIDISPKSESGIVPPLELNKEDYVVQDIIRTHGDHDHIDVGLKSNWTYISCAETGIKIPNGSKIHWCHPSRFVKIE